MSYPWNRGIPESTVRQYDHAESLRWIVPTSLAVHLAVTVALAYQLNIWVDEAHTMETVRGTLAHTLRRSLDYEMQPPLYFILLNLWGRASSSVLFLRLFSVLCMTVTIWLATRIGQRVCPKLHPGWLSVGIATNPFAVWAATEMRLYAFLILLASCLLLCFHMGFMSRSGPAKVARGWFVAIAVAGLYTQYFFGFLLLGLFLGLAAVRAWHSLRRLTLCYLWVAAAASPLLAVIRGQMEGHLGFVVAQDGVMNYLSVATRFLRYIVRLDFASPAIYMSVYSCVLLAIGVALVRYRQRMGDGLLVVWIGVGTVTICFMAILHVVSHELVNMVRTAVMFVAAMVGVMGLGSVVPLDIRRWVAVPLMAGAIVVNVAYGAWEYRSMAKLGDWKRVADFISSNEEPGEPVVVFTAEMVLPFEMYYRGRNTVIALPRRPSPFRYDIRDFVLRVGDVEEAMSSAVGNAERMWIVRSGGEGWVGVRFRGELLDRYVEEHCVVEVRRSFHRSTVSRLRRVAQ